jgi:hypothetical protein
MRIRRTLVQILFALADISAVPHRGRRSFLLVRAVKQTFKYNTTVTIGKSPKFDRVVVENNFFLKNF